LRDELTCGKQLNVNETLAYLKAQTFTNEMGANIFVNTYLNRCKKMNGIFKVNE
jgi:hypothetical protein